MKSLNPYPTVLCLLAGLLFAVPLTAQQEQASPETLAMVKAMTPGSQHAFLARQAGSWKLTVLAWTDPAAPPVQGVGTVEREMILGGRVLRDHFEAQIMGMSFAGVGHTGYDNVTGKYWSTWFDNVSTGLTHLEGTADESTGRATLVGRTPEAMAGEEVPMRMEIYFEDDKLISESFLTLPGKGEMLTMKTICERP